MSWSGFKKNVGRATTQVMMKTGHVDRTTDREYEVEERRYRTLEASATRLQKEARGYLDSLRAMTASQMRIAETIDAFYGESGARDGVSRSYKQAVEDLDAETIKALDGPYRQTVLEPINRFCAYFPDINECIKKRNHKMLDYDAMRSKVKKLTEKPDKDPAKLPRTEKEAEMVGRYSLSDSSDSSTVCRISNELNFPSPTRILDSPHRRAKQRTGHPTMKFEELQLQKLPEAFNKQQTPHAASRSLICSISPGSGYSSILVGEEAEEEREDGSKDTRQTADSVVPVSRTSSAKTTIHKVPRSEADPEGAILQMSQEPQSDGSRLALSSEVSNLILCEPQEGRRTSAVTSTSTGSPEKRMSVWANYSPASPMKDGPRNQTLHHRRISELKEDIARNQPKASQSHKRIPSGSSAHAQGLNAVSQLPDGNSSRRSQSLAGSACTSALEKQDQDLLSLSLAPITSNPASGFPAQLSKSRQSLSKHSLPTLMGPHTLPVSNAPKTSFEQQARSSTSSHRSRTSSRTPAPSFMNPSDLADILEPLKESYITHHADLCKQAKGVYEQLNEQLTSEIPQLIDLRVPYLDPTFEALVKIQLRFCAEAYSRMAQVQQYLDASTRDQYASGELDQRVEDVLGQIRELSIAGTV